MIIQHTFGFFPELNKIASGKNLTMRKTFAIPSKICYTLSKALFQIRYGY